jgi:outer membrane protein assembly factor BamB
LALTNYVGSTAIGYDTSASYPNLTLAMVGSAGRVATVRITVTSGLSYSMSSVQASATLPGAVSRAPYWCHCPGRDLIGVGSANGVLYLLDSGLTLRWTYDGQVDGRPAINTTPAADSNGDWYFGADDGYVYDVEIPQSGALLFKAARFGPGGAIRSSPLVGGSADGCSGPCMYFASSTAGLYYARLGSARIIDLRACISSAPDSTICAANPRLWARVEVGPPAIVGGSGVYVQGWSYYSP